MLPAQSITNSRAAANQLGALAKATVVKATPDLKGLDRYQAGGAIRTLATAVTTQVGKAASVAAVQTYDQMTNDALRTITIAQAPALKAKDIDSHIAAADKYRGLSVQQLDKILAKDPKDVGARTARMWAKNGYQAYKPITLDMPKWSKDKIDGVVGWSMSKLVAEDYPMAQQALADGVERMILDAFRDTIAENSLSDSFVVGYQRIASPDACAFCALVCLNEYTSSEEDGGYHDNCSCTTVPIYRGVGTYRPDYFDGFEQEYNQARELSGSTSAADILSAMRSISGRS